MNAPTASALCASGSIGSGRNQSATQPAAIRPSRTAVRAFLFTSALAALAPGFTPAIATLAPGVTPAIGTLAPGDGATASGASTDTSTACNGLTIGIAMVGFHLAACQAVQPPIATPAEQGFRFLSAASRTARSRS